MNKCIHTALSELDSLKVQQVLCIQQVSHKCLLEAQHLRSFVTVLRPTENACTSISIPYSKGFSEIHGAAAFIATGLTEVTEVTATGAELGLAGRYLPPKAEPFPLHAKQAQTSCGLGFYFRSLLLPTSSPERVKIL